jgi:hypothetical protein
VETENYLLTVVICGRPDPDKLLNLYSRLAIGGKFFVSSMSSLERIYALSVIMYFHKWQRKDHKCTKRDYVLTLMANLETIVH